MLFKRDFRLTTPDGQIIESAVTARAAELTGRVQTFTVYVCEGLRREVSHTITAEEALAGARAEAENERCFRLINIDHDREQRAFEADCQALAANHRFDVNALMFERDRYFFGNSTSRPIQLPRYERALRIAQERKAAQRSAA